MNEPIKLMLHERNDVLSAFILSYGYWERKTTDTLINLFQRCDKSNTIFVDIGAHIGYYSILAARYKLRVASFEPVSKHYRSLVDGILLNRYDNYIDAFMVPLSNKEEYMTIKVDDYFQTSKSKVLDSYFSTVFSKNMIIKIDIDDNGDIIKVLEGMIKTLLNNVVTHIIIQMYDNNAINVFRALSKLGYDRFYNIEQQIFMFSK